MSKGNPTINELLSGYAYKNGKDFAVVFDEWLDWCIDQWDIDNVISHQGNLGNLVAAAQENNTTFYECFTKIATASAQIIEQRGWHDAFGTLYEEKVKSGYKASSMGQFFTPEGLCDMMAELVCKKDQAVSYDCACGSGRLLLAAHAKVDHRRFHYYVAGDLDAMSCKMCALNFLLHGMFGIVERRDALSQEFFSGYIVNEMMYPIPTYTPSIRKADETECRKAVAVAKQYFSNDEVVNVQEVVRAQEEIKPDMPPQPLQYPQQMSLFNF